MTAPRRRRNPEQTRAAIVEALLAALKAGSGIPTAKDIAQRAGVSERSIFVHFTGRDDLFIAAVEAQSDAVEQLITHPDPGLPLADRIDTVVTQSAVIFEAQRYPRVLGLLESRTLPAVDARMRSTDQRIRDSLAEVFTTELTRDGRMDRELLDLIDATVSWPYRHHLMERRGLSEQAASKAIARALHALLG
ncbi:TetR/AcrR family transcriptional regulator [Nocardia goodfellowii]